MKIYDADIRNLLLSSFKKISEYTDHEDTVVIHEMDICFGVSRVDVAVINGRIHGYEIKSAQDNLERLSGQIESYNKVFNTMTIVTCDNHLEKVLDIVPQWWGVDYVASSKRGLTLKHRRKAKPNKHIDYLSMIYLLWRDEMIELLARQNHTSGLSHKSRRELGRTILNNLDYDVIEEYVLQSLKNRTSWKADLLQQLSDG